MELKMQVFQGEGIFIFYFTTNMKFLNKILIWYYSAKPEKIL
jgi:hypothetical protein